ncbi:hypothetical protein [uncultured Hymenobacter sp.]|uniref:hypothetical protein n=1 Tax=uncultured Hymenobacter sp. TaxID=170016 RepID=UPI0035CA08FE
MELDELRARWQQALPPPGAPTLSETALRELISRRSGSPIARLERSVWLESGLTVLFMLIGLAVLLLTKDSYVRIMLSWLLLLCLLLLPYYTRQMQIIRRLRDTANSVSQNVRRQIENIRALMQLYYLLSMWSWPVPFGIGLYFMIGSIMRQPSGPKLWASLGILGAVHAVIGVAMYFVMRWVTSRWLQKLYGQHLDRLEQSLAELDESAPSVSR